MECPEREVRRDSFLGDAEDYLAARPSYPSALLEASLELGRLAPDVSLLEVGCGTGEATEWFGSRGFSLLAMDRSVEMTRLASTRVRDLPNVTVRCQDFESETPDRRFAGLISATSYHWLDPNTRADRCARVLLPGGALILLWHTHPLPYSGFFERVQPIYRRIVPGWEPPPSPGMTEERVMAVVAELEKAGGFGSVHRRSHDWRRTYDRPLYLRLLNTYSDHRFLPEATRSRLLTAVGDLIDSEFGGEVERPYRTESIVSRRSDGSP
jgi:SAM-dependent methyltransferase